MVWDLLLDFGPSLVQGIASGVFSLVGAVLKRKRDDPYRGQQPPYPYSPYGPNYRGSEYLPSTVVYPLTNIGYSPGAPGYSSAVAGYSPAASGNSPAVAGYSSAVAGYSPAAPGYSNPRHIPQPVVRRNRR